MQILSGKELAKLETEKIKQELESLNFPRRPILSIVQVGDNEASNKYINAKLKKCEEVGVEGRLHKFDEKITQNSLLKKLDLINLESDGVIVQLPLPKHIPTQVILDSIPFEKDVDGLSTRNEFKLYNRKEEKCFVPATARAVMEIMDHYNINYKKDVKVCVVGRSHLVGKPIAHLIKKYGVDVATFNEKTGIKGVESGDVVIVAIGVAKYIKAENIKEGAVVIDIGINLDNKLTKELHGDVDFESVKDKVSAITPVPGGVGPMTVVCLLKNLIDAIK